MSQSISKFCISKAAQEFLIRETSPCIAGSSYGFRSSQFGTLDRTRLLAVGSFKKTLSLRTYHHFAFLSAYFVCLAVVLFAAEVYAADQGGKSQGSKSQSSESSEQRDNSPSVSGLESLNAITERAIIVKGTPLSESLQTYSGSVSLIQADRLQETGIDFLQNQILDLPNVNFAGGSSRPRFFQIRGVGDLEQYEGFPNSSVAVIVDDIDLSGVGAALTLFDIEQLEVHRGPQPTRFGSSAMAGAISVTSQESTDKLNGTTVLSSGSDQLISFGSALSGAITPGVSTRIAVFGHQQNGFRHNEFLSSDSTNERQEFTGRAKLQISPSDNASFTLQVLNVDLQNGYDAFSIFNGFETQSDRPGRDEETLQLMSLKGELNLNSTLNLELNTSYYRSAQEYSFDGDWGSNTFWAPFDPYDYFSDTDRNRDAAAQLIRLRGEQFLGGEALRYVLGLYWHHLSERTTTSEFADNQQYDYLRSRYAADTYATFAAIEYPLSDVLLLNSGVRFERRDSDFIDSRGATFTPDDVMWGGDISLRYTANEDLVPFIRVARGFRGGGFNASPSLPSNSIEFKPESLINFEMGARFSLFDDRFTGVVSSFVNYRDDQQLKLALQVDPSDPLSFSYVTDNAAKGYSYGAELESAFRITDSLSLQTQIALLDTRAEVNEGVLNSLDGRQQSHAPSWQYAAQVEKFLRDTLSVQVGIAGRDSFYFDDSHDAQSKPYHLLHASLFYFSDRWRLQFWGRNLTDEHYAVRGFFFGNEPPDFPNKKYVQLGDPRSFGFTWTYFLS